MISFAASVEHHGLRKEGVVKRPSHQYRLTLPRLILGGLILFAAYAEYTRRLQGWGWQPRLKEVFPWGLCAGLDVFCGLALAVGGFTIVAIVYLARLDTYQPILRVCMLTAFLGFVGAVLANVANRPFHFWALLRLWNPGPTFLGVGSALVLYGALLAAEFIPAVSRNAGRRIPSPALHLTRSVLALAAALLSTLQQISLTRPLVITPGGFSPLWLTPMFSAQLFLSSICGCLAVVVFASWHTSTTLDDRLQAIPVDKIKAALAILLPLYVCLRLLDLLDPQTFPLLLHKHLYNYLLGIELCLFLLPTALLLRRYRTCSQRTFYSSAVLVLAGFVTSRLNLAITAREAVKQVLYVPQWEDVFIAYGVIAICVALFSFAVRHLPIFASQAGEGADSAAQTELAHAGL